MTFDVIVVGGGHAGVEAATAAARMGASTLLVTHRWATIGAMSCNPAIGGLGKGHLVREVDALDGVMGRIADQGGIQFRVLNRAKGPAVQGPRAQIDRRRYARAMQAEIAATPRLSVVEGEVADLVLKDRAVAGVDLADGRRVRGGAVVLTAGTFLNGVIHIGTERHAGGRVGDKAVIGLSDRLRAMGVATARLKTGTPPRLDGRTIDWGAVEVQEGDDPIRPFSLMTAAIGQPQVSCGITRTTAQSHKVVREGLPRSAVYGGAIEGRGPRYCPSIEDKIVRFGDRDGHQVFLEPEGLDDPTVYPNGISTSLPADVQTALVASLPGCERARIVRFGYAIEYDYADPRGLEATLESKAVARLFLAGQVNGTTGYEEAAAQGLVAGINAARRASGGVGVVFPRQDSYIGVLIDDLVTRGVTEPYRMFTSRAEFRLSLRADNADLRLTPRGLALGLIGPARAAAFGTWQRDVGAALAAFRAVELSPTAAARHGFAVNADGQMRTAFDLLSRPDVDLARLIAAFPALGLHAEAVLAQVEVEARYAVYLDRQQRLMAQLARDEAANLPEAIDYGAIPGLSNELKARLVQVRPRTLGQAGRLEGMTPAALALLAAFARRRGPGADGDRLEDRPQERALG